MIAGLLLACRADPGPPDYPEREPWVRDDPDFYDDPLEPGEERLSIGLFYEGEATEAVPIDDLDTHLYVYEGTVAISPTDDRWEGYASDLFRRNALPWWGAGVHWDTPRDLSGWEALHLVVWTEEEPAWTVGLSGGGVEASVPVADHGASAGGVWQELSIPLEAFGGVDLSAVTIALLLLGEGGQEGDTFLLDGVYFTRGGGG